MGADSNLTAINRTESDFTNDPVLLEIAKKHGKTVGQIVVKFQTQRDVIVIPSTNDSQIIEENINVFDFELDQDDLNEIAKLDKPFEVGKLLPYEQYRNHPFYPFHEEY
jgi:diketogulonate reductase-like aldo/keto reductase